MLALRSRSWASQLQLGGSLEVGECVKGSHTVQRSSSLGLKRPMPGGTGEMLPVRAVSASCRTPRARIGVSLRFQRRSILLWYMTQYTDCSLETCKHFFFKLCLFLYLKGREMCWLIPQISATVTGVPGWVQAGSRLQQGVGNSVQ